MPAPELYPPDFLVRPAKLPRRRKNQRTVTMPKGVGPHVKLVFAELARQHLTYDEVEEASGVRRPTIKQWRRKNRPGLESLEAVLATLGFGLVPTPTLQVLPPELAGEITALSLKLGTNIPETWTALIDIGVEQKLLAMSAEERRAMQAEREARNPRQPANDNVRQSANVA
jgi:transcriptional regulator with XRE-family HTH domain